MLENTPSKTAELVALVRALEFVYYGEKSLLKDKYAARFLSDLYMAAYNRLSILPEFMSFFVNASSLGLFDFVTLRHALMDDYTRRLGQKVPIAVLGAGYDSRAQRLAHEIRHGIWEFDFPATQRRKKFYLRNEPPAQNVPHYCEIDFGKDDLAESFVRSGMAKTATLVIWEGVSMYVGEDVVRRTLKACRDYFGERTILVFDYWHSTSDDALQNLLLKLMPVVMDAIYSERFTFGAQTQQMRELAMSCGARRFESLTGKQIMKRLFLTSRLPLSSASVAVVEF